LPHATENPAPAGFSAYGEAAVKEARIVDEVGGSGRIGSKSNGMNA